MAYDEPILKGQGASGKTKLTVAFKCGTKYLRVKRIGATFLESVRPRKGVFFTNRIRICQPKR